MGHRCCICGINTIFFVWSSTRNYPRDKLASILKSKNVSKAEAKDVPVCIKCSNNVIKR